MSVELEPRKSNLPAGAGPPGNRVSALKGRKKAAVLLVSIGSDRAADVFRHLRDEEIETLSLEMAAHGRRRRLCA